jgi:hypothetical protein
MMDVYKEYKEPISERLHPGNRCYFDDH